MNLQRSDYGSGSSSSSRVRLIFTVYFRKFFELKGFLISKANHDVITRIVYALPEVHGVAIICRTAPGSPFVGSWMDQLSFGFLSRTDPREA